MPPALVALVAPDSGMERQARVGKAGLAFLIALVCALLSAFAHAYRVDTRDTTLANLEKSQQLENMSDRAVEDEVVKSNRLYQAGRVAWGVVETPLFLGLGCIAALALVWFTRGKLKGRAIVPVAAAALLPNAVGDLLDALTAWQHAALPADFKPIAARDLNAVMALLGHPLAQPWARLGFAFDFFSLWAAVLMAFGVAAAGDVPHRRALVTTLVAWVCWRLLIGMAFGG